MKVLGQEVPAHVVESAERFMRTAAGGFQTDELSIDIGLAWVELVGRRWALRTNLRTTLAQRLTQKHRKLGNLKFEGRVWSWVGES